MQVLTQHTSLGDQVSKKMSAWILVLIVAIILTIFFATLALSLQLFNKQVGIWKAVAPQYALTNLIDSDHFSLKREVALLQSTGLFSSFAIMDNQKRMIAQFGDGHFSNSRLIPIKDEAKVIWGYYAFKANFYHFFSSFLIAGAIFLVLILNFYFLIRQRIRSNLESEFARFNQFLNEVELITKKLHEIYHQENEPAIPQSTFNAEQVIINRAISRLLEEIKKANKAMREAISAAEQRRFQEELTRTALQVVHDICSPLALLEAIVQSTSLSLPEADRIAIRNAIGRLRDIANTLLKKAKQDLVIHQEGSLTQQLVAGLINQVIGEKRMQHGSRIDISFQFNESSYGLFALIRSTDFCRAISNLVNNAVDAIEDIGCITISLYDADNELQIKIQDNGKGIPSNMLAKIGQLGATYGKPQGMGMGLYHAKQIFESWGGRLAIRSQEGQGTTVQIALPKAQPSSWFVPEIKVGEGQTIVVIDDDESIHEVWKKRLESRSIKLLHFYSPEKLIEWQNNTIIDGGVLYLCDHEFIGSDMNGIDLVAKLKINYLSILVTSRVTDEILSSCEVAGIKLLPKDMAFLIPLI